MKITIVDPHLTNFVFNPVKSFFDKTHRIPKKYNYLSEALFQEKRINVFLTYSNSSVFGKRRIKNISEILYKFLSLIEVSIWAIFNKISINIIKNLRGNVIFFGTSGSIDWNFVNALSQKSDVDNIFIHLTHYYTFDDPKIILNKKVVFLSDFDISDHNFFKEKFPLYKNKIIEVPFCVRDHFYSKSDKKKEFNILMIGSVHKFNLSKSSVPFYSLCRNFKTTHPIRLSLVNKDFGPKVLNHIRLVTPNGLGDHFKKYLSFDLKKLFSMSHYVLCPSEGSGLIGISTLEAMASGCGIIISEYDLKLLKLDKSTEGVIVYKNQEDLLIKIKQISHIEIKPFETKKLQLRALDYKRENLIKSIKLI